MTSIGFIGVRPAIGTKVYAKNKVRGILFQNPERLTDKEYLPGELIGSYTGWSFDDPMMGGGGSFWTHVRDDRTGQEFRINQYDCTFDVPEDRNVLEPSPPLGLRNFQPGTATTTGPQAPPKIPLHWYVLGGLVLLAVLLGLLAPSSED